MDSLPTIDIITLDLRGAKYTINRRSLTSLTWNESEVKLNLWTKILTLDTKDPIWVDCDIEVFKEILGYCETKHFPTKRYSASYLLAVAEKLGIDIAGGIKDRKKSIIKKPEDATKESALKAELIKTLKATGSEVISLEVISQYDRTAEFGYKILTGDEDDEDDDINTVCLWLRDPKLISLFRAIGSSQLILNDYFRELKDTYRFEISKTGLSKLIIEFIHNDDDVGESEDTEDVALSELKIEE